MMQRIFVVMCMLAGLAACGDRPLRDLDAGRDGPDEFSVLPTAPLTIPADLTRLPPPQPGGVNPVDPNPQAEAVVALGGNPAATRAGGIPSQDAALVAYSARNGSLSGIRSVLAQEDAAQRAGLSGLGGLFRSGDRYFRIYAPQALDAYQALDQLRAAGVATPTAPPLN